jgi:hypothetical protein
MVTPLVNACMRLFHFFSIIGRHDPGAAAAMIVRAFRPGIARLVAGAIHHRSARAQPT